MLLSVPSSLRHRCSSARVGTVPFVAQTPVVVAVDAGTTGIRALVIDERARAVGSAYRELTQHFPEPGRVEHGAAEIRDCVLATLGEVAEALEGRSRVARAIGITNQRETVVAWDRNTGEPVAPAIVWQDRRSAHDCTRLVDEGHLPLVRERTGLVLDPYFSATKIRWMLDQGASGNGTAHPGPIWWSAPSTAGCSGT